jgi:uncharacterized repeat protein (TIGR03803 family)
LPDRSTRAEVAFERHASGNLWGLTENGGANDDGTLFEIPAANVSGGPVDQFDLGASENTTSTAGFVTNSSGIAPAVDSSTIAFFGELFSSPVAAAARQVHPDGFFFGAGAVFGYHNPFSNLLPSPAQVSQQSQELANEKTQFNTLEHTEESSSEVHPSESAAVQLRATAATKASPSPARKAALAAIKKQLATTRTDLKTTGTLITKESSAIAQYNKEANLITALDKQLAAQTKPASKAAIQRKITGDTALQNKFAAQANTEFNSANTSIATIQTLETNIQTALNTLPA